MHTFLVRSLNQQGFLIRDLKILSVTARDLTHKSTVRPAGPIHASHFFPCENETVNYHQGHRKREKPCNKELVLTESVLVTLSESRAIHKQKTKPQPATLLQFRHPNRMVWTSAGALELAQYFLLCQHEIIFVQGRVILCQILLVKIITYSDTASYSVLQWRKCMVCVLSFRERKHLMQFTGGIRPWFCCHDAQRPMAGLEAAGLACEWVL